MDWRERNRSFEALAAFGVSGTTVLGGDQPVRATVAGISRDFWDVFPVEPVLGRLTVPEDHGLGVGPSIVIGEGFWESRLGGDPGILGRTLGVNGVASTVVGVAPRAFDFPLGKVITSGGMDEFWAGEGEPMWAEVVGVVADAKYQSLVDHVTPTYYFPLCQRPGRSRFNATGLVKPAPGADAAAVHVVRDLMLERDPDVPLRLSTLEAAVAASVSDRRFVLVILGIFSAVALLLAGVGIYGVVSYHVARRTREMGIRLALGAPPAQVRGRVLKGAMAMVGGGVVVGLGVALLAGRLVESRLFGVRANDPTTLAVVLLTLVATDFLAALVPAVRSTRIDPMITMRGE